MSEDNGLIRLEVPNGTRKMACGAKGAVMTVDVVGAYHRWCDFLKNDAANVTDYADQCSRFVQELGGGQEHNRAEAVAFVRKLDELYVEIFPEVKKNTGEKQSSAATTESTLSD